MVDESLFLERMVAALSVAFGGLATLLAAIGLYGVMSYTVARRTREIGIRMALGAERGSVMWLVLREVALMVGIGVAIGVPLARRDQPRGAVAAVRSVGARSAGADRRRGAARGRRARRRLPARPPRDARRSDAGAAVRVGELRTQNSELRTSRTLNSEL